MKILFLTIYRFNDVNANNAYTDLMRKFRDEGHEVYVVTPLERRFNQKSALKVHQGIHILGVKTLNLQKTNTLEKGLGTLLLESQYQKAIQKYLKEITFDLILYSTPPITFTKVIQQIKKRDHAVTYLLLKDIFPQNAVDLGMIKKKSVLYRFFRKKEQVLYQISDRIGCMSPANVEYLLKHNREIAPEKVEINPNSIEINPVEFESNGADIRIKYNIPLEATLFIYGGNLGKPQGVPFLMEILHANLHRKELFFLIIGSGTAYSKMAHWFKTNQPSNSLLLSSLPQNDYAELVRASDVGLIFLDHRFTIPNFPSRVLSYLENKKPILAATDPNTDIGKIAEENQFGLWCESNDIEKFILKMDYFINNKKRIQEMGQNGFNFLINNYSIEKSYNIIMNCFNDRKEL